MPGSEDKSQKGSDSRDDKKGGEKPASKRYSDTRRHAQKEKKGGLNVVFVHSLIFVYSLIQCLI